MNASNQADSEVMRKLQDSSRNTDDYVHLGCFNDDKSDRIFTKFLKRSDAGMTAAVRGSTNV